MIKQLRLLGALAVFSMTLMAWASGTGVPVHADECLGQYDEYCASPEMCGAFPPEEVASCMEWCRCYHECVCFNGEPAAPMCGMHCGEF
jgi:hypothetical protein